MYVLPSAVRLPLVMHTHVYLKVTVYLTVSGVPNVRIGSDVRSDFGGATLCPRFKTSAPRSGRPLFGFVNTVDRGAGLFVALGTSTC